MIRLCFIHTPRQEIARKLPTQYSIIHCSCGNYLKSWQYFYVVIGHFFSYTYGKSSRHRLISQVQLQTEVWSGITSVGHVFEFCKLNVKLSSFRCFVCDFYVQHFRALDDSFSSFRWFQVRHFRVLGAIFRVLGASFSSFSCFNFEVSLLRFRALCSSCVVLRFRVPCSVDTFC